MINTLFTEVLEEHPHYVVFKNKLLSALAGSEHIVLYDTLGHAFHDANHPDVQQVKDSLEAIAYFRPEFTLPEDTLEAMLLKPAQQLILNMTNNCTLRCTYCPYTGMEDGGGLYPNKRKHEKTNMDLRTIKQVIIEFSKIAQPGAAVSFYGGEATINFQGIEFAVDRAKKILTDPHFTITTNLAFVSEEQMQYMCDNDFAITVSLDGPQEIHDSSRVSVRQAGTHARITNNLNTLIKLYRGKEDKIRFIAVISDPKRIEDVRDYFNSTYPGFGVSWSLINPQTINGSVTTYNPGSFEVFEEVMFRWGVEYVQNTLYGTPIDPFLASAFGDFLEPMQHLADPTLLLPHGICSPGRQKVFVTTEGRYLPCHLASEARPIGDLKSGLNTADSYQLIEDMIGIRNDLCPSCYVRDVCTPCYVTATAQGAMSAKGLSTSCATLKGGALDMLALQSTLLFYQNEGETSV